MASKPRIEAEVTLDTSKLKKGAADAEKSVGNLGDALGKTAKDKLGPMGDALDKVGIDLNKVGAGSLVAGAGIAGLAAGVAKGVSEFQHQAEEVRKFKDAVGTSWDASSRLVAISDDLGISAESVGGAMKKLATNLGNNAGLLDEYGISTVRAKDGTVDMVGTLGNVADAFNSTTDATQRNAMAQKLFGKSWADLAPLLQQGGKGIRDAAAGVKDYQLVSAESAEDSRKLSMAMDDMQDAVRGLEIAMAKGLIPMLTEGAKGAAGFLDKVNQVGSALSKAANKDSFWWGTGEQHKVQQMADEMKRSKTFIQDVGVAMGSTMLEAVGMNSELINSKRIQQENADKAALLAARTRDLAAEAKAAAAAVKQQESELAKLRDTVYSVVDAQLAYDASVTSLNNSTDELAQKHEVLTEALAVYGEGSAEAWKATKDYQTGIHDAEQAAVANAQATKAMAEQQAIAAGVAMTAEQSNLVYRNALVAVRDASTDPNLTAGLNGLIGLVDDTAAAAGRAQAQLNSAAAAASRLAAAAAGVNVASTTADAAESILSRQAAPARASGGPVSAGQAYTVGEQGTELFVPQQSGTIVPNNKLGAGGSGNVINLYGVIGDYSDIARLIHGELLALERGKR